MRIDELSTRLSNILEIAALAAAQEARPVGERHLLHGFLSASGGLTEAVLSGLEVDLEALAAWLQGQAQPDVEPALRPRSPFEPAGGLRTDDLDGPALRLCQDALSQAAGMQHSPVQVAHLVLASTEVWEGFAAALWQARVPHPSRLGERMRRSLADAEGAPGRVLRLDRSDMAPGLQRLLESAWQARGREAVPHVTVRHLFRSFPALDASDFAPLSAQVRQFLLETASLLGAHPLFSCQGLLAEEGLDASARRVLAGARRLAEEAGLGSATAPALVAALLESPGGPAQAALRRLGAADPAALAQALLAGQAARAAGWRPACTAWQFSFDLHSQEVLRQSAQQAETEQAPRVTEGHLWLGVLRDGRGSAVDWLEQQGVHLEDLRRLAGLAAPGGPSPQTSAGAQTGAQGHLDLTRLDSTARRILERSARECAAAGSTLLSTAHLFIALTKVDQGLTQQRLRAQGHDPTRIRCAVRAALPRREMADEGKGAVHEPGESVRPSDLRASRRYAGILAAADALAQAEGCRIGEQHLLAAFLADGGGTTGEMLRRAGIDLAQGGEPDL